MAQVYNKLEIDVHGAIRGLATPVQNDANSRFLDVVLLDNGTAINLTGHEVRIYCKKPENGGEIYNNGEITDAVNGRCQFPLTDQTLAEVGYVEAQISIFYENVQILQTHIFHINVVKSLMSESSIESSNEYGALVVLFQELYEAKDLMTTMVQSFGEKGAVSTSRNINTFWQSMEYVSKYLDTDIKNLLNTVLANASVSGVISRLGNAADTGATATAGTVMGKLNKLMTNEKYLVFKTLTATLAANKTDFELLSITGAGEFYGLSGSFPAADSVKMIIDGVTHVSAGNSNAYCNYKPSIYGLYSVPESGTYLSPMSTRQVPVAPFKESLTILVNSGSSGTTTKVAYALYE